MTSDLLALLPHGVRVGTVLRTRASIGLSFRCMVMLVIPPPNAKTLVEIIFVATDDGNQAVQATFSKCECGCLQWFQPIEPHQKYVSTEHQQADNNAKRRKTGRRQKL